MATYVVSDIHGLKNRFDRMLADLHLQATDHLYILGDIVDRGPSGIALLQACMQHPQITLLMGNHEFMMLEVLHKEIDHLPPAYDSNMVNIERWNRNGNQPTLIAYQNLSLDEQVDIIHYLKSLPLVIPALVVNGCMFYLVHAHPVKHFTTEVVTLADLKNTTIHPKSFVWDRILAYEHFFNDRTVVFGHTMTDSYPHHQPYTVWKPQADLIGIDCGCATDQPFTKLACLCLDTMEVRYYS